MFPLYLYLHHYLNLTCLDMYLEGNRASYFTRLPCRYVLFKQCSPLYPSLPCLSCLLPLLPLALLAPQLSTCQPASSAAHFGLTTATLLHCQQPLLEHIFRQILASPTPIPTLLFAHNSSKNVPILDMNLQRKSFDNFNYNWKWNNIRMGQRVSVSF